LSAYQSYNQTFKLLQEHHKWFQESIPLIASENVSSLGVREALASDFGHRYAEGWPEERVYAGCTYIDKVELLCIDLMKKLFGAEFVDVRPISGVVSNLVVYTAFTEPEDVMMALSIPCGGHITTGKKRLGGTAGAVSGLKVEYLALDYKELNIDVDKTKDRVQKLVDKGSPPKLVMFGASVFPFPHPVKELAEISKGEIMLSKIGKKKKLEIVRKAKEKGINIVNLNIEKFLKKVERKKQDKEKKKKEKEEKEKKKKEKGKTKEKKKTKPAEKKEEKSEEKQEEVKEEKLEEKIEERKETKTKEDEK